MRNELKKTAALAGSDLNKKLEAGDFKDDIEKTDGSIKFIKRRGSNANYERLSDRGVVEIHAGLLFKDGTSAASKTFVNGVVETAQAFSKARRLIKEHWDLSRRPDRHYRPPAAPP